MFATRKFRDVFGTIDDGISPQTMATGTTSGSAIALGGPAPLRKLEFIVNAASGSAAATLTFLLQTATASNGTFASFSTSGGGFPSSASLSLSAAGKYFLYVEARDEMFTDLGTTATWVKPVFQISAGAPIPLSLTTLGFVSGSLPASNFDSTTLAQVLELDLLF